MKHIFIIFFFFNFICYSGNAQKNFGRVIIDEKLAHWFFENPPIVAQEGSYKVYIDSVLVESNDNDTNWNVRVNADIRDLNRKHYSFDFCNSFFSKDTLEVEFKPISKFLENKIVIKIINDKFYAILIDGEENKQFKARPISLKLRKRVQQKGEKIFGELEVEFSNTQTNYQYSFKGPFMCIVE